MDGSDDAWDEDRAEATWRELVGGRAVVVARYDRDDRAFLLVRRCRPAEAGRRALTPRERVVLVAASLGRANKQIAIETGLSESAASTALHSAIHKLGIGSRLDLVRWSLAWGR